MHQSTKAALLSGLIFPGMGQLSTGNKKRGWIFVSAIIINIYLMINEIISEAQDVILDMQRKGMALDADNISKATSELSGFSENIYLNVLLVTFIIIWFISIVDAYKMGKLSSYKNNST